MEYCIADSIYHLSNNPKSEIKGWCFASKKHIAKFLGTDESRIFRTLPKLIKNGFVEKSDDVRGYLRTTQKWYDNIVITRIKADYGETPEVIAKRHNAYSETLEPTIAKRHTYNNTYNNNNKDMSAKPTSPPFSYKEKLNLMKKDKRKHIKIISYFWQYKAISIDNEQQYKILLKRSLKPANDLTGFSIERINEVMDWLANVSNIGKWELETVIKYISEDLDNLEPFGSKQKNYGTY